MSIDRRQALGLIASASLASGRLLNAGARAGALGRTTGREPFLAFDGAEPAYAGGITSLPDGGFAVDWQTGSQVVGRHFDPDGAPRSSERSVITGVTGAYDGYSCRGAAAPVALSDGTLVAFVGKFEGANAVWAARLDATGALVGRPSPLHSANLRPPYRCYASRMTGDRAIVVWTTRGIAFGSGEVHWRIVGAEGAPISPISTLAGSGGLYGQKPMAVQGLDDGRSVIAYFRTTGCVVAGDAFAQVIDGDGEPVGEPYDLDVDTGKVALAALPHGAWSALWPAKHRSFDPFFWHDRLACRVFDANGTSEPPRSTQVYPDDDAWYGMNAVSAAATADGRILASAAGFTGTARDRKSGRCLLDADANAAWHVVLARLDGEIRDLRQEPTPLGLVRLTSGDVVAHWRGCRPVESVEARSACLLRVA